MNHNPKLRFAHVFDKEETIFNKITFGIVGKVTKSIVRNFATGIENNQSNSLAIQIVVWFLNAMVIPSKNPWRRASMLIVDQEIPIQPISKKSTNGK